MSKLVVVTGATGNVGKELAEGLLARGVRVRAIGRSAERLASLVEKGAEAAVGSVEDGVFLTRAFQGADAVFAMIPPNYGTPDMRAYQKAVVAAFASSLRESRVPRVVTLSSVGADQPDGNGPVAGLYDLERAIAGIAGLHAVHVRAGFFMENHLQNVGLVRNAGINGSPLKANLPIAMIATKDIAAFALGFLADPAFTGQTVREAYASRNYTMSEATAILGAAIGKPALPYVEFSYEDARKAMVQAGVTPDMAGLYVEMYQALNEGRMTTLEPRSPANSTPTSLEEFAKTFAVAYGS